MSGESRIVRSGTRDLRLDFIRGLALYMILVDHVIGDPLSHFTYRVFGYSDAAEIFVFVSGLVCGIVYYRLFNKSGWSALLGAVTERASRIYVYYALSSLAIVLIVAISHADIDATLSAVARNPVSASWHVLGMMYSPPFSGILLLYLPLTLIVMPLFFWGARRNVFATLCVSGAVWLIAQLYPQFGAMVTDRTWLNPLAWQFLFVIGLFFGMRYSASGGQPIYKRAGWLVAAAWLVVSVSFLYRLSIYFSPHLGFDLEWLRIPVPTLAHMKETLSAIRVLHFLSMALLFATYVRPKSPILQLSVAKPFIMAGQRSLEMFAASMVFSMATNAYVVTESPTMPARLILDCAMIAAMALTAIVITRSGKRRGVLVGKRLSSG